MMTIDEKLDRNYKLQQQLMVKLEDLLARMARLAATILPQSAVDTATREAANQEAEPH
jgi:hypothetical protein